MSSVEKEGKELFKEEYNAQAKHLSVAEKLNWLLFKAQAQDKSVMDKALDVAIDKEINGIKKYKIFYDSDGVPIECSCPHHTYRGAVCKHLVAEIMTNFRQMLEPKYPQWYAELDKAKEDELEKALKELEDVFSPDF